MLNPTMIALVEIYYSGCGSHRNHFVCWKWRLRFDSPALHIVFQFRFVVIIVDHNGNRVHGEVLYFALEVSQDENNF